TSRNFSIRSSFRNETCRCQAGSVGPAESPCHSKRRNEMETPKNVVTGAWLEERLGATGLSILDGSWYLPAQGRDGHGEYLAGHVPGAQFFDQDRVVAAGSSLPHSLPSPEEFAEHVSAMGVSDSNRIVVYDGPGFFSAPRLWWMLRVMGAENVYLLEGGMDRWKAEGRPVASGEEPPRSAVFSPRFKSDAVVGFEEMRSIVGF